MATGSLLAIETSQHFGGVALRGLDGAIHVEPVDTELHLDDDLIAAIDRLCRRVGITSGELGAVGVSIGPGGFTGLRIAVGTAKMLAETLGVRLVAVPTAHVVAESHDGDGPILVALAAKGDRFWATRLEMVREQVGKDR